MLNEVWLTAVVAMSGLALVLLLTVLMRGTKTLYPRGGRRLPDGDGSDSAGPGNGAQGRSMQGSGAQVRGAQGGGAQGDSTRSSTLATRGLQHVFAGVGPRRPRSVEHNLERAFRRIDSVDPYAAPRRIGQALSASTLLGSTETEHDGRTAEHDGRSAEPERRTAEPERRTAEPERRTAEPERRTAEPWPFLESRSANQRSEDQQ